MISFIRGLVADTTENAVILENNGIGYEIFMTGSSIEQAIESSYPVPFFLAQFPLVRK